MQENDKKVLLYVGCGRHRMKGFTHADINMSKQFDSNGKRNFIPDILCDISDHIPLPDNSVTLIFSRGTLEHLTYQQLINHLLECHRLLKKQGVVRAVVPDFDIMINKYNKKTHYQFNQKENNMPNDDYVDTFINNILYHDHYYLHNFHTLKKILKKTGFDEIVECEPGVSSIKYANDELLKAEVSRFDEIIIEAKKLDNTPSLNSFKTKYPKNPILYILAKYFNIKIVPFKMRRSMFPDKKWFQEKFGVSRKIKTVDFFNKHEESNQIKLKYENYLEIDLFEDYDK